MFNKKFAAFILTHFVYGCNYVELAGDGKVSEEYIAHSVVSHRLNQNRPFSLQSFYSQTEYLSYMRQSFPSLDAGSFNNDLEIVSVLTLPMEDCRRVAVVDNVLLTTSKEIEEQRDYSSIHILVNIEEEQDAQCGNEKLVDVKIVRFNASRELIAVGYSIYNHKEG